MQLQQISSQRIILNNILSYTGFCIFGILAFFFIGSRGGEPYIERFNVAKYYYTTACILMPLSLFCYLFLPISKSYIKKKWEINKDKISDAKGNEYSIRQVESLRLLLNPAKYKPKEGRTIKYKGGNNWIEFTIRGGRRRKFEFLIENKEDEDNLMLILEQWKEKVNVFIGQSRASIFFE